MSSAIIIFDNRALRLDEPKLLSIVAGLGYKCRLGEWRYLTETVAQVEVSVGRPFALQINDHETVIDEVAEMVEDRRLNTTRGLETLNARIEVVSGEQPVIHTLPGGGIVSYTPELSLGFRGRWLLRKLARQLSGLLIYA